MGRCNPCARSARLSDDVGETEEVKINSITQFVGYFRAGKMYECKKCCEKSINQNTWKVL